MPIKLSNKDDACKLNFHAPGPRERIIKKLKQIVVMGKSQQVTWSHLVGRAEAAFVLGSAFNWEVSKGFVSVGDS